MAYTKASMRATNKWVKENYDTVHLNMKKGRKDVWKEAAQKCDMSLNEFIRTCVEDRIKNM